MADKKKDKKEEKPEEKDEAVKGEGGEGEAPAEGGKKKLPLKLILIIVGVVVLLGGGAAAAYFMGVFGGEKKEAAAPEGEHAQEGEEGAAPKDDGHGEKKKDDGHGEKKKDDGHGGGKGGKGGGDDSAFFNLGDMMVNITGDGRRQSYLKLVIQLELESADDKPAMEALKPRIIDNFQTYLRELRVDDLRGSAGLYRLREELLFRVSDAAHPIKIKDVLFQQMLIQ